MLLVGPHVLGKHVTPYVDKLRKEAKRLREVEIAEKSNELWAVITAVIIFVIFVLTGAAIFSTTEDWSYFEGLYFCMVFSLTIGYVLIPSELISDFEGRFGSYIRCWPSIIHPLLTLS